MPNRIARSNLIQAAITALTASGEQSAFPRGRFRDQLRSATWRSPFGWEIIAGFNDKLDFNRGGVKVATIAAGIYATGGALATAIVTALEAADATPVWACSYSVSTFKFTISTSSETFTLLFGTGANIATDIALDIGFAESDTGSASSQTGGSAVYQSRHFLGADLKSALAITMGAIINHNLSSGGTAKLQSSATSVLAAATAPAATQDLTGDTSIRVKFFGSQSHRYLALVINDTGNTAGFAEVGIWYAGTYDEPSVWFSIDASKRFEGLSTISDTIGGAHYQARRAEREVWDLVWLEVPDADRVIFEAIKDAAAIGTNLFFFFDPATPTRFLYCYRRGDLVLKPATNIYWNVSFPIAEALG